MTSPTPDLLRTPLSVVVITPSPAARATSTFQFRLKLHSFSGNGADTVSLVLPGVRDEEGDYHKPSLHLLVRSVISVRNRPHFSFITTICGPDNNARFKYDYRATYKVVEENNDRVTVGNFVKEARTETSKISYYEVDYQDLEKRLEIVIDLDFAWKIKPDDEDDDRPPLIPGLLSEGISALAGELSDFVVVCAGRSIPTYRNVLAARSVVFRAMFQNSLCLEVTSGRLVVEDEEDEIDPDDMERFLDLLLKDRIGKEDIVPHELGLYSLAHKYQIESLRSLCAPIISAGVGVSNCADRVRFGKVFEDEGIISAASRTFRRNKEAVMATEGWKRLSKNSPGVAIEFLAAFVV